MPNPQRRSTGGDTAPETTARPKFSRRPASFSRPAADPAPAAPATPAPLPLVPEDTPALATPGALVLRAPSIMARPWQEDVRFGVVMVLLVVLVNLALFYGLKYLPLPTLRTPPTIGFIGGSLYERMEPAHGRVTLYAPEAAQQREPLTAAPETLAPETVDEAL